MGKLRVEERGVVGGRMMEDVMEMCVWKEERRDDGVVVR